MLLGLISAVVTHANAFVITPEVWDV